jgi:hypothetical protein
VTLSHPERKPTGRRRKHPVPSVSSVAAAELIEARPEAFRTISWRTGTKGPLKAVFAAMRVRVADGPVAAGGQHLPGEEVWLVGEHRATGERKYYLSNLGLDHFEGRSWRGLHHHALLCQLAFAFLQHLRLGGKKRRQPIRAQAAAPAKPARHPPPHPGSTHPRAPALPTLPAALRASSPAMNVAG